MRAPVTAACIQVEPAIFDRTRTIDRVAERTAEAAGAGAGLVVFPETFIPAYPSSVWAKALAGWASRERRRRSPCSTASRSSFQDQTPTGSPGSPGSTACGSFRRQRGRPGAARDALQLASLLLARGRAGTPSPQARADESRAARLGTGRRPRAPRNRDVDRPARWPDLLGELHAAGAVLALRVGHRDLHRLHRGRRRLVAGDVAAHRARVPLVRRRAVPLPTRELVSRAFRSHRCSRAATSSAAAGRRFSARTGATSPDRSTTRRGSSTPSSIRTCCSSHASASTRPATTTVRTCSA